MLQFVSMMSIIIYTLTYLHLLIDVIWDLKFENDISNRVNRISLIIVDNKKYV